jgi:tRNA(fMet)-specific endonuclease VapC
MQPTPQTLLIDTNIVSFILKRDTRASAYAPLLDGHRLAVSFATVAELYEWASIRKWGQRRQQELTETLATYLVIPVDIALCRQWGALRAEQ